MGNAVETIGRPAAASVSTREVTCKAAVTWQHHYVGCPDQIRELFPVEVALIEGDHIAHPALRPPMPETLALGLPSRARTFGWGLARDEWRAGSVDDIGGRGDIDHLLRVFYRDVFDDALLRRIFIDIAHMDLEAHLPVLGDFWETVLFNTSRYHGHAMEVHQRLNDLTPLRAEHFQRWLEIWDATLDAHYERPVTAGAKSHANRIATTMQRSLARAGAPPSLPTRAHLRLRPG